MADWTVKDIPAQQGRLVVITGATGGLGFQTARALAGAGARVVLTGRDATKGRLALDAILAAHPTSKVSYETLDLASLASVHTFADRFERGHESLDLLVNNGGVMTPPTRQLTADSYELQFGTNYLSHYALTARLLPALVRGRQPRVVNLSSLAHRMGARIDFEDLERQKRYRAFASYAQSKLAMLMFTFELQRRSDTAGWGLTCLAAHPGFAKTDLLRNGQLAGGKAHAGWTETLSAWLAALLSQSAANGAMPVLFAATSPDAKPGGYYGPTGFLGLKGAVGPAVVGSRAKDLGVARQLWEVSAKLSCVSWDRVAPVAPVVPVDAVSAVAAVGSFALVALVAPVAPVAPVSPGGPVALATATPSVAPNSLVSPISLASPISLTSPVLLTESTCAPATAPLSA